MRQDPVVIANRLKAKKNKNPTEEGKSKCKYCGYNHFGKCRHSNATCRKCGKTGHLERVCEDKGGNETSKPQIVCTVREFSGKRTQETPLICMANLYQGPKNAHDLLIDSGAAAHIICNKDLFQEVTFRSENSCLETSSGEVLSTEGKGSLLVPLDNGNRGATNLILTNAPDLKFNLISTIQLGKKGISTYLMADDKPAQLVHKGKVVGLAKTINNQYFLQTTTMYQSYRSTGPHHHKRCKGPYPNMARTTRPSQLPKPPKTKSFSQWSHHRRTHTRRSMWLMHDGKTTAKNKSHSTNPSNRISRNSA